MEKQYAAKVFTGAAGKTLSYRELSPANPAKGERYPLVLVLHGSGERGNDNAAQLAYYGPAFAAPEAMAKHPCFVLAPQCPKDRRWVEVDWAAPAHALPQEPSDPLGLALELVDQAMKTLPVDPDRIYITGISMGGFGTWDAICRRPGFFAAAIPICGGGDLNQAPKLTAQPIWAFHGADDPVVQPARTTGMVAAIEKAGGHPKMTIYPGVKHDSWVKALKDPEFLAWLFGQKRGAGK